MNIKHRILAFTLLLIAISSCKNSNNEKQIELELKERELILKEKELSIKEAQKKEKITTSQNSIFKENSKIDGNLSNIENLIGYWFTPHAAIVNIRFNRSGRFEFNDYNTSLEKDELLIGEYKLENGTLTLKYDDRPKQKFKFHKGISGDENYYIEKSGYYFVKGENRN